MSPYSTEAPRLDNEGLPENGLSGHLQSDTTNAVIAIGSDGSAYVPQATPLYLAECWVNFTDCAPVTGVGWLEPVIGWEVDPGGVWFPVCTDTTGTAQAFDVNDSGYPYNIVRFGPTPEQAMADAMAALARTLDAFARRDARRHPDEWAACQARLGVAA